MSYERQVSKLLKDNSLLHLLTGLSAECGEVNGIFQKAIYKKGTISIEDITSELGDVLFYITSLALHYDLTLDEIQNYNIKKLKQRG